MNTSGAERLPLRTRVIDACREDLSYVPPREVLDAIGDTFLVIPWRDPIRTWWTKHQLTSESPEDTNTAFLQSQGIEVAHPSDIDLEW